MTRWRSRMGLLAKLATTAAPPSLFSFFNRLDNELTWLQCVPAIRYKNKNEIGSSQIYTWAQSRIFLKHKRILTNLCMKKMMSEYSKGANIYDFLLLSPLADALVCQIWRWNGNCWKMVCCCLKKFRKTSSFLFCVESDSLLLKKSRNQNLTNFAFCFLF